MAESPTPPRVDLGEHLDNSIVPDADKGDAPSGDGRSHDLQNLPYSTSTIPVADSTEDAENQGHNAGSVKRKHCTSDARYFLLNNLSESTSDESLRQNMLDTGIPPAA